MKRTDADSTFAVVDGNQIAEFQECKKVLQIECLQFVMVRDRGKDVAKKAMAVFMVEYKER